MRLLFLSAFYPPHEIGGWEQLTQELVERLRARGHDVRVLTSTFGSESDPQNEPYVARDLLLENNQFRYNPIHFILRREADQRYNFNVLQRTLLTFQPQAVMIHSMWNLSRMIPWKAEQLLPGRVIYYLADYWPCDPDVNQVFWKAQAERGGLGGWRRRLANKALRHLATERERHPIGFDQVIFVSQAVRKQMAEAGIQWAEKGCVIYNGIDVNEFSPSGDKDVPSKHLLFVGSLSPHKGIHTVLDALALLRTDSDVGPVRLAVAGGGHHEHVRQVTEKIEQMGLDSRVEILGRVPRNQMPELYRQAYALVFPSIWQEPLARTTQEAMACGVPVIATLTGGTRELIVDGINGLTFEPGNAEGLATQVKRLWTDPALARQLSLAARQTIIEKFNIEMTTSKIEQYLLGFEDGPK